MISNKTLIAAFLAFDIANCGKEDTGPECLNLASKEVTCPDDILFVKNDLFSCVDSRSSPLTINLFYKAEQDYVVIARQQAGSTFENVNLNVSAQKMEDGHKTYELILTNNDGIYSMKKIFDCTYYFNR